MTKPGTFTKVKRSSQPMYGDRKLLVCGYPGNTHDGWLKFLKEVGLESTPTVFATDDAVDRSLKDLMALPGGSGTGMDSTLARAVIVSGLTETELHRLLGSYRKFGGPRQFWAVLTPVSETWSLGELLAELEREHRAMQQRKKPAPR